ncbi:hypothetical protein [Photobacterium leiognathi]|uniref:hypothetical protein n=1 Tax=Photobacterium leiognathi TaxID=553611 RepID=UPI0027387B66|nr:hypothetical protein [Photobacterium leiognathi]
MAHYKLILICLLTSMSSSLAASEIYKCTVDGKITLQDFPCKDDYKYGMTELDTFDGWKYGMNILAFKQQAKMKKLPINPGTSAIYSQYNEKYVNSQPDARIYNYSSTIAGQKANVALFFTQKTQVLYRIKVNFFVVLLPSEEKQYFYTSLVNQLSAKYGQYIESKDYPSTANDLAKVFLVNLVGTEKVWGAETDSIISLTGNSPSVTTYTLDYRYSPLVKTSISETTDEIRESTDKAFFDSSVKL